MAFTPLEYIFAGMWLLQTLSAAVSAMPTPVKTGWYSWFYKFSHQMTNNLDSWFEQKYGVAMPHVVDETAVAKKITTAEGSETTIATRKTETTNP